MMLVMTFFIAIVSYAEPIGPIVGIIPTTAVVEQVGDYTHVSNLTESEAKVLANSLLRQNCKSDILWTIDGDYIVIYYNPVKKNNTGGGSAGGGRHPGFSLRNDLIEP